MAEERVQRRLAAILAADVVGYSRLMGAGFLSTAIWSQKTFQSVGSTPFAPLPPPSPTKLNGAQNMG